ncbi:MAG: hypothetical protein R3C25_09755 [Hyphomonadaceae bacterium]
MRPKFVILSALIAATALVAPVQARAPQGGYFQPNWVMPAQDRRGDQQNIRPLREIVDSLRARYGGDLISARLEQGGRPIYVIRWRMPDGEVRDFRVDAVSGR